MKSSKPKLAVAVIIVVLIGAVIMSLWQDTGSGVALAALDKRSKPRR